MRPWRSLGTASTVTRTFADITVTSSGGVGTHADSAFTASASA